jgi:hypothetical protein
MEVEEPGGVPGAVPATSLFGTLGGRGSGSGVFEIARADNAGLGIVLLPAPSESAGASERTLADR